MCHTQLKARVDFFGTGVDRAKIILNLELYILNTRLTLRYTYSSRGASSSAEIISTNQPMAASQTGFL